MRKKKFSMGSAVRWVILLFFLVITVYPVIWMIFGSLKTTSDFYTNIWGIPETFQISNYIEAWGRGGLGQKYINSIFVTGLFLLIIIPVNCCAAYVLARVRFQGRKLIYMSLLVGMMIPGGILGMPTYSVALKLGLVNSTWGIAFVYAGQAISFGVFLMRSFYISLPKSLEDAAMIDGCNRFQSFVKVVLPLTKPGIMIQVVFSGLNTWNEYFLASIMLRSDEVKTLPFRYYDIRRRIQHRFPTDVCCVNGGYHAFNHYLSVCAETVYCRSYRRGNKKG